MSYRARRTEQFCTSSGTEKDTIFRDSNKILDAPRVAALRSTAKTARLAGYRSFVQERLLSAGESMGRPSWTVPIARHRVDNNRVETIEDFFTLRRLLCRQ